MGNPIRGDGKGKNAPILQPAASTDSQAATSSSGQLNIARVGNSRSVPNLPAATSLTRGYTFDGTAIRREVDGAYGYESVLQEQARLKDEASGGKATTPSLEQPKKSWFKKFLAKSESNLSDAKSSGAKEAKPDISIQPFKIKRAVLIDSSSRTARPSTSLSPQLAPLAPQGYSASSPLGALGNIVTHPPQAAAINPAAPPPRRLSIVIPPAAPSEVANTRLIRQGAIIKRQAPQPPAQAGPSQAPQTPIASGQAAASQVPQPPAQAGPSQAPQTPIAPRQAVASQVPQAPQPPAQAGPSQVPQTPALQIPQPPAVPAAPQGASALVSNISEPVPPFIRANLFNTTYITRKIKREDGTHNLYLSSSKTELDKAIIREQEKASSNRFAWKTRDLFRKTVQKLHQSREGENSLIQTRNFTKDKEDKFKAFANIILQTPDWIKQHGIFREVGETAKVEQALDKINDIDPQEVLVLKRPEPTVISSITKALLAQVLTENTKVEVNNYINSANFSDLKDLIDISDMKALAPKAGFTVPNVANLPEIVKDMAKFLAMVSYYEKDTSMSSTNLAKIFSVNLMSDSVLQSAASNNRLNEVMDDYIIFVFALIEYQKSVILP